ncbi:hypothetical protein V7183_09495 [Bacillus sp. JJ1127]|uniref:hypothetical protein n=1 Tax=Bacillus sp. JJ1127 TaxID=3122952 RepID=UPI002FFEC800
MKDSFKKGLQGQIPNKMVRGMVDLTVSPSTLDPARIGKALYDNRHHASPFLQSNTPLHHVDGIQIKVF